MTFEWGISGLVKHATRLDYEKHIIEDKRACLPLATLSLTPP